MTPHDRYQRRIDLAGEIKQADELVLECERDCLAKSKALELSKVALRKQLAAREEKHAEARRLAKEASDDFLSLIPEPPVFNDTGVEMPLADETAPNVEVEFTASTFWHGADFQAQALQNGEVKLNQAFDEATR